MSTPTEPDPGPGPETTPDGHTWLDQEYCADQRMWAPPTPQDMPPEWPAWRLPDWYAGRTGMVQIPGQPGQPGVYQYVWGGWLPWQSLADRFDHAGQWPDAVQSTVGAMQAELWPPTAAAGDVPLIALSAPDDLAAPPLSDPISGPDPTAPEGN
ncbi:hypothetical protein GCM10009759_55160 [Kitasatospora saccharophila]|uniref:Uncharacterized protein n=1 Tax=Kitasatospora saccharophila TaxID=407973 RepID=A0ABN2XL17_9ACTN